MPSRPGFQLLEAEHGVLRAGLRRALETARQGSGRSSGTIGSLTTGLRRHMRREDRALYPLCERLFSGWEGAVSVLKGEHDALRKQLDRLRTAQREPDRAVQRETLEGLARLVDLHFAREERVLFPLTSARMSERDHRSFERTLRADRRNRRRTDRT